MMIASAALGGRGTPSSRIRHPPACTLCGGQAVRSLRPGDIRQLSIRRRLRRAVFADRRLQRGLDAITFSRLPASIRPKLAIDPLGDVIVRKRPPLVRFVPPEGEQPGNSQLQGSPDRTVSFPLDGLGLRSSFI